MTPVKETKEYNRIFRKVLFQVLIDPTRGKLFKDLCDARGEKASAVLRNLAYQYTETHADGEDYKDAESEDMRLMNKAQESRIANGFNWTKKRKTTLKLNIHLELFIREHKNLLFISFLIMQLS